MNLKLLWVLAAILFVGYLAFPQRVRAESPSQILYWTNAEGTVHVRLLPEPCTDEMVLGEIAERGIQNTFMAAEVQARGAQFAACWALLSNGHQVGIIDARGDEGWIELKDLKPENPL